MVGTGRGDYPAEQSLVARAKCDGREFRPETCGAEAPGPAAVHPIPKPVLVRSAPRGTVTPALRKKIFHRDRGVCRTPGCMNSMFLEIHHIKPVSHGGGNDESNMILLCSACHKHVHENRMKIAGVYPDIEFFLGVSRDVETPYSRQDRETARVKEYMPAWKYSQSIAV